MKINLKIFNLPDFFKRVLRRLGLDSKQKSYFFYTPRLKSSRGSLIALAAIFMVVVAIIVPVAMTLVEDVSANTRQAQLYVAGAQNAARAGLEDALGYFIRQDKLLSAYTSEVTVGQTPTYATGVSYVDQPFNPIYNTSNAEYSDTFEATTVDTAAGISYAFYGLCNEYPIDAANNTIPASGLTTAVYFGRYEVQEQANPIATHGVTMTPNPLAVHDISGDRESDYLNGDGLVWAITSTGYIYKRMDFTMNQFGQYLVPYNVYPNVVMATARAYTEFRKLDCNLPDSSVSQVTAAVYCSAATNVSLSNYCQLGVVSNQGLGLICTDGQTKPTGANTSNFFGGGVSMGTTVNNAPLSDINVFGMSIKDIQFIADYVGSSTSTLDIVGADKLSYFNGNLTYAATQTTPAYQRLDSSGILVVNGNLTLGYGGNNGVSMVPASSYSGLIFVTGNMTISDGCAVDGSVIMGYSSAYSGTGGKLTLLGSSGGSFAYLTEDPQGLSEIIQLVAQYREDISARKVLLAFPGI